MDFPETIYINGEVHTMDDEDHIFEAIAVKKGRILSVGSNESILRLQTTNTIIIDLQKKTVIPGFTDAHLHVFPLGFNLSNVDCRLSSIEEIVDAIQGRATQLENEEEWIIGWGYDESLFKEGRKIEKWDLASIKNPVYITRYCLHEAVANEQALQKAGISSNTTIENGRIPVNIDGETTGILIEKAMTLMEDILPPYSEEKMTEAIQLAVNHLVKNGITSIHDAGLGFFDDPYKEFSVLRKMAQSGKLQIRVYAMILAEYYFDFIKEYQHFASEQVKIGSMKLFADGTLSGQNAAMEKPYKNTSNRGMLLYTDDALKSMVRLAHVMNMQVAVHAIGDRAISQVLRIYEQVQNEYPMKHVRHRIEHTMMANEALLEKMKNLGVIPVPQPALIHTAGDVHHEQVEDKNLKYFAFKSFFQYDLRPAASSDSPVADCNPMLGIYAAMGRETVRGNVCNLEERITLKQAIQMYTVNAAYASFEEEMRGTIERGKYADFTVLPNGFMSYTANEVKHAKIEMTIVHGQIVYQKSPVADVE